MENSFSQFGSATAPWRMPWILLLSVFCSYEFAFACVPLLNERNVALNHPVCQSSVIGGGRPRLAVDGNMEATYQGGSCTHTDLDYSPWWRLNLTESYKISAVFVVNRKDCCRERLYGAEIYVGDSDDYKKNILCGKIPASDIPSVKICCDGIEGQYVTIILTDRRQHLTLCEVEVYGVPANRGSVCDNIV
ncbi:fucolectin-1-like [Pelobates fuscus]|uniref:fucolectin-1-like n=1 Tax=Pelobates fuscus TaxID=191477 RepID=UPI002FE4A2C5